MIFAGLFFIFCLSEPEITIETKTHSLSKGALNATSFKVNKLPVWGYSYRTFGGKANSIPLPKFRLGSATFREKALQKQLSTHKPKIGLMGAPQPGYFWQKDHLIDVFQSDWISPTHGAIRVISQNECILRCYPLQLFKEKSTQYSVQVFNPNPIIAAADTSLRDHEDSSTAVPQNAYTESFLDLSGTGSLQNAYGKSVNLSEPDETRIANPDSMPHFTRDQKGFEEVNILFHLTKAQNYIQSLGFSDLQNRPIPFDAHALHGDDQSTFSIFLDPAGTLEFGDGGVDDGEDADIIYHEYFHAIHFDLAGESMFVPSINIELEDANQTNEAGAIAEAVADYFSFAMTYDVNMETGLDPTQFAEWDGANDGVPFGNQLYLRGGNPGLLYPDSMSGNFYWDSQVLSEPLMDLRTNLPFEEMDQSLLTSLGLLGEKPLFRDFVRMFTLTDQHLHRKDRTTTVAETFSQFGLEASVVHVAQIPELKPGDSRSILLINPEPTRQALEFNAFDAEGVLIFSDKRTAEPFVEIEISFEGGDSFRDMHIRTSKEWPIWVLSQSADGQEHSCTRVQPTHSHALVPHIAKQRIQWETMLYLSNPTPFPTVIEVLAADFTADLAPFQSHSIRFSEQEIPVPGGWSALQSHLPWAGMEIFWKRSEEVFQRTALPLATDLATRWIIPHIPADTDLFWTGIACVNPGDEPANLAITAFNAQGEALETQSFALAPLTQWLGLAEDAFPGLADAGMSHWQISSDQPITGFQLFGTRNDQTLASLPFLGEGRNELILPIFVNSGSEWQGIALFNPSNQNVEITIAPPDGTLFPKVVELQPNQKTLLLVSDLQMLSTFWARITADQPILGMTVFGDTARTWMDATRL